MMSRRIMPRALVVYSLAVVALGGCGEIVNERKIDGEPRMVGGQAVPVSLTTEPATISKTSVAMSSRLNDKSAGGSGSSESPTGYNRHQDFSIKADAYWKVYWIHKDLDAGHVPDGVDEALQQVETRLTQAVDDSDKARLVTAISDLREGLEAHRIAADLRAMGQDFDTLPWGTGSFSMQERFKREPVDPSNSFSSLRSRTTDQSKLIDWEGRFHASPRTIERLAYRRVADALDYLKNELEEKGKEFGDTLDPDKIPPPEIGVGSGRSLRIPPLQGSKTQINRRP